MSELVTRTGKWFYKSAKESVPAFVNRLPPSRTSVEATPWICAHVDHEMWEPPPANPNMVLEFDTKVTPEVLAKDEKREKHQIDLESLLPLFNKHGYYLGKWVFFVDRDSVDDCWERTCTALYGSGLGCGVAKVSPAAPELDVHVIAIYTLSYANTWDVKRVAEQIRTVLGVDAQLKYKPEAATQLGLYCENERWGPRPTTVYVSIRGRLNAVIRRRVWDIRRGFLHEISEAGILRQT
ncbi:hypothetical protein DIPPA_23269 [Diplonema papillatum]|nr:hypothetical protein DIPPA_23269 [Diplonema papillatum]